MRNARMVLVPLLGLLVLVCGVAAQSAHANEEVDIELIMAVDVSGSVDDDEAKLLRHGHVAALRHPQIIKAIQGGFIGRIAVTYVEWAGYGHIETIVGWRVIKDRQSAESFAAKILKAPYRTAARTAISDMIMASIGSFEKNGFSGTRLVLDLAGDGANNFGIPVHAARDRAVNKGIIINGIPILSNDHDGFKYTTAQYLDTYYQKCVIGGAGSFVVVANGFADFARAIKRKMILEIALVPPVSPVRASFWPLSSARSFSGPFSGPFPRPSPHLPPLLHRSQIGTKPGPIIKIDPHCFIGEERWQNRGWDDDW
ncbi:MAG: DUF1194 domain-containing protein [Proteobacteria bacterium]|nr:DUF1194 domain-containing protein [Pseudomonadota bacterium]